MRNTLPRAEYQLRNGLATKVDPGDLGAQGLLVSQNADGFAETGAWGKTPGSSRQSEKAPAAWEHLAYYEYFDLRAQLQRVALGLAGSVFYKINADRTLESLKTDLNAEPLSEVTTLNRIHFAGSENEPFKYDGERVTRWGAGPPGSEEEVFEGFDDHTTFSINGSNTKADSAVSKDFRGSVEVNKVDLTTDQLSLTKTVALNFAPAGQQLAFVWFLLPAGASPKLASSGEAVRVGVSDGANTDAWTFQRGDLVDGWNLLVLDLAAPTIDGGADQRAITALEMRVTFDAAGLAASGFLWDKLYVTDEGAPSARTTGTGAVTGAVTYRTTYLTSYGFESNAGPASASVDGTSVGSVIEVQSIPRSPDPQVIARRLYRDLDGDAQWRLVAQVDDNSTTSYVDNTSPAGLGTLTPPLAGDSSKDHSPPSPMRQVVVWKNHVWGIDAENRFQLDILDLNDPEAAPLLNIRQFDFEITALMPHALGLLIKHSDGSVVVLGDTLADFRYENVQPVGSVGCSGFRAWAATKRISWCLHDDGPYVDDALDPWYVASPIRDVFDALDSSEFRNAHVAHDRGRFRIVNFLRSASGGDYDALYSFGYGSMAGVVSPEGSGIDPLDLRRGAWTQLVLPSDMNPKCSAIMERQADRPELWVGCDDGYVYRLQDPDALNWADGLGETPVNCVIQSGWLPVGADTPAHPRFVSIEMKCSVASTWTITVRTANEPEGAIVYEHIQTRAFRAGVDSAVLSAGPGGEPGEWIQVELSNNNRDEDGIVRNLEVLAIPRRFRGAR